ncbi:replication/maintenance protein RepL [Candidatus Arsenophonus triatominarum]|uniref:replication/maintenance protein RepL n=1 Tax=Candidatus Arsenophonus triatominarum TaxID=57911 RepID=UPI0007C4465A|nr:replication/maintenance protein RepL [Candidatus Arsenophonus triatominarum]
MKTSKRVKLIGHKTLVDRDTGEEIPMQMNLVEDRDFNFHKVWLQHLIHSFDEIVNQKLKLAFWIIENLNKENQLVMTQRKIAEMSGISYQTVSRTIRLLAEGSPPFLQRINAGAYRINPDILFKGSHSNRMGICYEYIKTKEEKTRKKENSPIVNPESK